MLVKNDQTSAKAMINSKSENIVTIIPVTFEGGASWEEVKSCYYVRPEFARLMEKGTMKITISKDGSATFDPILNKPN